MGSIIFCPHHHIFMGVPPFQYCDTPELTQWHEQHTYTTLLAKSSNKRYYRGTNVGETDGRYSYITCSMFPSTYPQRGERESLIYISNSSPRHINRRNLSFNLHGIFLHTSLKGVVSCEGRCCCQRAIAERCEWGFIVWNEGVFVIIFDHTIWYCV